MSRIKYGEDILRIIEELETTSSTNALSLLKNIEEESRQEIGTDKIAFFSNPIIIERLIKIGQKYEGDDKILEEAIRTVTIISERFDVKTQNLSDFMISHIESKNNKIKYVIASYFPFLPQFNDYNEKWEYILSIPTILPKSESIHIFRRVIERRIDEIPSELRKNIIKIMENFVFRKKNETLDDDIFDQFMDILNKLRWDKYNEEMLGLIGELETTPLNAFSLIKKIERETRQEIGIVSEAFFSNPIVMEKLIKIAYNYETDEKILELFVRTLVMISERFKVNTQCLYSFLMRHAESKNKWINFVVATRLGFLPQFDNYENKWGYILSIPKIPPKRDSMRVFRLVIKQRIDEVPDELKKEIIIVMRKFLDKENLVVDTHNLFLDIIEQLSNSTEDLKT
ncbi:hypothetical protein LSPCS325_40490 [Lysinibacillus sp. CTST325]|uniref:hypothetical protein n=1 Tax=Lysinibacillus sp. NPDC056185 TaxID=3345739 RepID=UPI0039EF38AE